MLRADAPDFSFDHYFSAMLQHAHIIDGNAATQRKIHNTKQQSSNRSGGQSGGRGGNRDSDRGGGRGSGRGGNSGGRGGTRGGCGGGRGMRSERIQITKLSDCPDPTDPKY